jgi:3-methyladenine DNA glycosylase/8-oxoguanine DNA glycosylase
MDMIFSPKQPYSLTSVIRSHGWIQLIPFENQNDYQTFAYTMQLSDDKVIRFEAYEKSGEICVKVPDSLTESELTEIRQAVTWMLAMDIDLSEFYKAAADEPHLQKAIEKSAGRILRSHTLFEDVLKTILTTNTLWAATKSMNRKLVELYGTPLAENPAVHAFPTPSTLANVSEDEIKEKIRVGYRAPFIHELAVRISNGSLDVEALRSSTLSTAELKKEFQKLKGIGPYAAAHLLMLMGRYDFIPIDSWALKMVSLEWHNGDPIKPIDVEKAFEKWGQFKGLAYWMWEWTNNP